jgi:4-hydroxy-tetrahydrodipicolinate reductase
MVNVIMHGCNGHMGQTITNIIKEDNEIEIVAGIDLFDDGHNDYPVFKSFADCNIKADAIIDFCNAKAVDGLLDYAVSTGTPVVLCSTGLSDEQLARVNEDSKKVAILRSANMSLGVNLIMKLLKEAAAKLVPAGFDIEIVEKHHNQKIDAPSGTAIMLANAINETLDNSKNYVYDRHSRRQKRDKNEIGISSIRGGTIVGEHDVIFAGNDEVITLSHSAFSKRVFAEGSVNAAIFLKDQKPGLYDMSKLI